VGEGGAKKIKKEDQDRQATYSGWDENFR